MRSILKTLEACFLGCRCGLLPEMAKNPTGPIKFEAQDGEYRLYYDPQNLSAGYQVMHYCLFCGGRLTRSAPSELWTISHDEEARLIQVTSSLKTVADVQAALGPPDDEATGAMRSAIRERVPQETELLRVLTYRRLSTIANVMVFERMDGSVGFTFLRKAVPHKR